MVVLIVVMFLLTFGSDLSSFLPDHDEKKGCDDDDDDVAPRRMGFLEDFIALVVVVVFVCMVSLAVIAVLLLLLLVSFPCLSSSSFLDGTKSTIFNDGVSDGLLTTKSSVIVVVVILSWFVAR